MIGPPSQLSGPFGRLLRPGWIIRWAYFCSYFTDKETGSYQDHSIVSYDPHGLYDGPIFAPTSQTKKQGATRTIRSSLTTRMDYTMGLFLLLLHKQRNRELPGPFDRLLRPAWIMRWSNFAPTSERKKEPGGPILNPQRLLGDV